jgi:hypothetical protein
VRTLDRYATGHLTYEIEMATSMTRYVLASSRRSAVVLDNALLEAMLVHLRLLDDFFGSKQQLAPRNRSATDDVFARHWLPSWQPRRFLTETQRGRANAQITHLAARRRWNHRWPLPQMTSRCCRTLLRFVDELEQEAPQRAKAFAKARGIAQAWLATQEATRGDQVATPPVATSM